MNMTNMASAGSPLLTGSRC